MIQESALGLVIGGAIWNFIAPKRTDEAVADNAILKSVNPPIKAMHMLETLGVKQINVVFIFVREFPDAIEIGRRQKKTQRLDVKVVINGDRVVGTSTERFAQILFDATVEALVRVATKYGLPPPMIERIKQIKLVN